jgi:hypothetical protein
VLRAYLRLVLFALGLLVGVQAPGFIDQYAKRVGAHYSEAQKDFAGFQHNADQYFAGNVEALIAHHQASDDAVFRDEAKTVAAIYARLKKLTLELEAMSGPLPSQMVHVAFYPDKEILNETIAAYSYTVPLNPPAIACGLLVGLLLALLIELVVLAAMGVGRFMMGHEPARRRGA